ncbi:MAG: hypothetical protein WAW37_17115 [Syntrophobacteraceae bacterium]
MFFPAGEEIIRRQAGDHCPPLALIFTDTVANRYPNFIFVRFVFFVAEYFSFYHEGHEGHEGHEAHQEHQGRGGVIGPLVQAP